MKKIILIIMFLVLAGNLLAKKSKSTSPLFGTWKYSKSSAINDFQRISNLNSNKDEATEYMVFNKGNEFKHEFVNKDGQVFKTLKGKWKIVEDKIKINYSDIDFQLSLNYFFIDTDLVLGQNFNHIIFTKDILDERNLAFK